MVAVGATVAVLLGAAAIVLPRVGSADPTATVTVMTRNLYLGADITRPLRAAGGQSGPTALAVLGRATDRARAMVDRTDFRIRSRLLAAEIAAARPDLVGLQEAALWRSGPLDLTVGPPDATTVDYDFLDLLLAELGRAGTAYDVVVAQTQSDVEAPAFPDPRQETGRTGRDVRVTLRDVVLVRAGSGVTVHGRGSGQFAARLAVDLAGARFEYVRGFAWADVEVGGQRFRFLTTHLESEDPELARAQAAELLAGPAADAGQPVVVAGDLNAAVDPPGPAYAVLTAGGLADRWPAAAGPGFTFGLSAAVDDDVPAFSRRIDHVLARGLPAVRPDQEYGALTGDRPEARDPATGLWPSDHAGLVVRLALG